MSEGAPVHSVIWAIALSAALGLVAVVAPGFWMTAESSHVAPLFPIVHVALEGFGLPGILGLFVAGAITRLAVRAPSWVIGLSSMAAVALMTLAEMLVDSHSHSLFPIEFFSYAVLSIFAMAGALAVVACSRLLGIRQKASNGA